MFNLPPSMGDGTWGQPTFVPQISNEIIDLIRMNSLWAVWCHRQQFEKAQPVDGDLDLTTLHGPYVPAFADGAPSSERPLQPPDE
jgi:hypothetical protein